MAGRHFELLVCAGVSAAKWRANEDPEGDRRAIDALCAVLAEVRCDRFVLISTIDVWPLQAVGRAGSPGPWAGRPRRLRSRAA